uniref:ORF40h n=1 Tax=Pinus koraiensis TaxID=88728 RepID=A4QM34_PINKO|nr:ORF40h [Pinus koraiensis]ABP35361.1 ORF40h [Pinus koraiensis]
MGETEHKEIIPRISDHTKSFLSGPIIYSFFHLLLFFRRIT